MSEIRVERIRVADLYEFARAAEGDTRVHETLPITALRAFSQSRNPAASGDDVGMIVAYADGRCVGYLGILPCWIRAGGETNKVYCLSGLYVREEFRGKGVADAILGSAMALGVDLVTGGNTRAGRRYFESKTEWFPARGTLAFLRIRLERFFPVTICLRKLGQARRLRPFRRTLSSLVRLSRVTIDRLLWPLVYRVLRPSPRSLPRGTGARRMGSLKGPDTGSGDSGAGERPHFHRDDRIANWMIHDPWITEEDGVPSRYFFSYRRERFRFLPFELSDDQSGACLGYAVFSVSTKDGFTTLKILDHRLAGPAYLPVVFDLALKEARRWKADAMEGSFEFRPLLRGRILHRWVAERRERRYFFHPASEKSPLAHPERLLLDYCDVDIAFV